MLLNKKTMEIVISDTTALIIFAKADKLELLANLFNKIFIPKAVEKELQIKDDIVQYRLDKFDKISSHPVNNTDTLQRIQKFNLDNGEVEAITLAIELDLKLIIDERKGRQIAINEGLKIVGVLGILIENYKREFISFDEAGYYFDLFKNNGLRVSESLEKIFFERLKCIKQ